jgi:hypothetical protein
MRHHQHQGNIDDNVDEHCERVHTAIESHSEILATETDLVGNFGASEVHDLIANSTHEAK